MEELNKGSHPEMTSRQLNTLNDMQGEWVTMTIMAKMLHPFFSIAALRQRAKRGTMPFPYKQVGNRYFAKRSDVEDYLRQINK